MRKQLGESYQVLEFRLFLKVMENHLNRKKRGDIIKFPN